ncbi:MAG: DUF4124 domain-containing protein [Desulfobacterales bacterium]|nr:DUF4124 domain-containing protein [Desulfobacterales bacterium]
MRSINIVFIVVCIAFGITAVDADVYTWVDENGVRHYSDSPPDEAEDAKVVFPEYKFDEAAEEARNQEEQEQINSLIEEIEAEDAREQAEEKERAKQAELNREPTREELIAAEKERLEKKIAFLEEQPLEYFGSQRNKIVRIGYYHYQIQELMENPDKYFNQPASFEGNVKYPPSDAEDHASGGGGY